MSIRSTVRITGAAKNAITKLLVDLGDACSAYQHATLRDLTYTTFECDEIWNFVGMKDKNVPADRHGEHGMGSVWTWTAICADTRLIPAWFVGQRTAHDGYLFMMDLRTRLKYRRIPTRVPPQWQPERPITSGRSKRSPRCSIATDPLPRSTAGGRSATTRVDDHANDRVDISSIRTCARVCPRVVPVAVLRLAI